MYWGSRCESANNICTKRTDILRWASLFLRNPLWTLHVKTDTWPPNISAGAEKDIGLDRARNPPLKIDFTIYKVQEMVYGLGSHQPRRTLPSISDRKYFGFLCFYRCCFRIQKLTRWKENLLSIAVLYVRQYLFILVQIYTRILI